MLDGLPLRVLDSLVRTGDAVAENPRIQRPTGVDVLFAEVGVAVRVFFDELFDRNCVPTLLHLLGCLFVIRCKKPGIQWFLGLRVWR